MPENKTIKRQVAHIVQINDIINAPYTKQEGWQPNYLTINNKKVSRVNIIGTIVSIPTTELNFNSAVIDDGTNNITIRSFENNNLMKVFNTGEIIQIIGKPREYNNEKYIIPEIITKINDNKWILVRKKIIELNKLKQPKTITQPEEKIKVTEENIEEPIKNEFENILNFIAQNDKGDGVDITNIIENIKDSEKMINLLLKEGEIFEISPGKVKVLT